MVYSDTIIVVLHTSVVYNGRGVLVEGMAFNGCAMKSALYPLSGATIRLPCYLLPK